MFYDTSEIIIQPCIECRADIADPDYGRLCSKCANEMVLLELELWNRGQDDLAVNVQQQRDHEEMILGIAFFIFMALVAFGTGWAVGAVVWHFRHLHG